MESGNFPAAGTFDHQKWSYDGAFEQLFGSGRGDLHKNFQKFKCPGREEGGMLKLQFDWYIIVKFCQ